MKQRLTNAQRDWLHNKLQAWVNDRLTILEPSVDEEREKIKEEVISTELLDDTKRWYDWIRESDREVKKAQARLKENIEYFVMALKHEYPEQVEKWAHNYRFRCADALLENVDDVERFIDKLTEKEVYERLMKTEVGQEKTKLRNTQNEIGDAVMLAGASGQLARVYQKLVAHFGADTELATILEVIKELADEDNKE